MKKIQLVTGGAGFIGSHLVEALVKRGDSVRVVDNLLTGFVDNLRSVRGQIDFVEADITDAKAMHQALQGVDCVFHQAALASVPRSVEDPLATHAACTTGTLVLLDAARKCGVRRLVYAASSSAYGDQPHSSKRETDLPKPLSPYAASKLAGEYYCQAFTQTYGLATVGLRYFNVFGPRQDPNSPYSAVIPLFITRILAGQSPVVFGDGQQTRDFSYVANVVHANLLAAESQAAVGHVMNIANGRTTSLLELLTMLQELLGVPVTPQFQPARVGDVRDSLADITRAHALLGYEPQVDFASGLKRCVEYYRSAASH